VPLTAGSNLTAASLGLASAATWGAGDFSGGLGARRAPVLSVVAGAHAIGLILLVALAAVVGESLPGGSGILWGGMAGAAGALGVGALYRALAIGPMSLVAPISAVLSAAIPAVAGAAQAGSPPPMAIAGFALAALGVWMVSRTQDAGGSPLGLGLAVLSGIGFGVFLLAISQVGHGTVLWALAAARASSFILTLALALASRSRIPSLTALPFIALSGVLDPAGNVLFVLASAAGRLDVAAVLSSLYPVSTVVLSVTLLHERLGRFRAAGIAAIFAAVVLIAAS